MVLASLSDSPPLEPDPCKVSRMVSFSSSVAEQDLNVLSGMDCELGSPVPVPGTRSDNDYKQLVLPAFRPVPGVDDHMRHSGYERR